jgi:hypothetical protein
LQLERELHAAIVATFDPIVNVQDGARLLPTPEGAGFRREGIR